MFDAKVVIVTGAATGLGEGIAEGLCIRGARLVLADIDLDGVRAVAARLDRSGQRTLAFEADVSDPEAHQGMVAAALDRFGALNLAVNNAGITGDHGVPLAEIEIAAW